MSRSKWNSSEIWIFSWWLRVWFSVFCCCLLLFTVQRPVNINIPQSVLVPVSHSYPVHIPIVKPVVTPYIKEITIPIEKVIPFAVIKKVPYIFFSHSSITRKINAICYHFYFFRFLGAIHCRKTWTLSRWKIHHHSSKGLVI